MATTSDLKNGIVIKFNGELHTVMTVEHRTPGNLRAFYQVKMRNLKNGRTIENRFRSGEEIEIERLEFKNYQFLYKDDTDYYFMDNDTYEQTQLNEGFVGEQGEFLKPGQNVQITFHDGKAIALEMPPHVELLITSAPPGVKGNTATGATKQAILETGAVVNVPLFVNEGDIIRVDIRTRGYVERVKS
ncbi:MAG: elongation factor P [Ignavibacteriae bacterium]|nr:elongation factor P [Ignavibacteriota bacterium]